MSGRREFLRALAGIPLACAVSAFDKAVELPTGCDLTMTSLNEVLSVGRDWNFGRPRVLLIGPENIFPARELLGWTPEFVRRYGNEVNFLLRENLTYEVTGMFPKNTWAVQFERGMVKSIGP